MADTIQGNIKKIYFVGIKGVGMAGLAIIAKEAKLDVQGSDIKEEFITDSILRNHKIRVDEGFGELSIKKFFGDNVKEALVVTTAAHDGLKNAQCKYALKSGIKVLTHGQAVGYFMDGGLFKRIFRGISVLGTHGKTTITAMLASSFISSGLDPTYTVGTSEIFPNGDSGRYGHGPYFIAEADEFISDINFDKTVKFLYQTPNFAVINNIDFDHPDVYSSINEVKLAFLKFCIENIKNNGKLIINGDDDNCKFIINHKSMLKYRSDIEVIKYGENEDNNLRILNFREKGWGSEFEVFANGISLGKFELSVPGYHNAKNSLAVISVMISIGINLEEIKKSIKNFQGTKRRQEILGETKNKAVIVDDYAHHPDEIKKTIEAVKNAYKTKKIVCLFQPHTLGRTIALKEEFSNSFNGIEELVLMPIFTSKRENEINYEQLYNSIKKSIQKNNVKIYLSKDTRSAAELSNSPFFFPKNRKSVVDYIKKRYDSNEYIILSLGAGDLYKVAYELLKQ